VEPGNVLEVEAGGVLHGYGTITGEVTNAGLVLIDDTAGGYGAGVLEINGDYTQTSSGVLDLEWGGGGPLDVTGTAALDGTLNVTFVNGFAPILPGELGRLIWDGAETGTFATVHLPSVSSGHLYLVYAEATGDPIYPFSVALWYAA
jgi:autotransporter family porin